MPSMGEVLPKEVSRVSWIVTRPSLNVTVSCTQRSVAVPRLGAPVRATVDRRSPSNWPGGKKKIKLLSQANCHIVQLVLNMA